MGDNLPRTSWAHVDDKGDPILKVSHNDGDLAAAVVVTTTDPYNHAAFPMPLGRLRGLARFIDFVLADAVETSTLGEAEASFIVPRRLVPDNYPQWQWEYGGSRVEVNLTGSNRAVVESLRDHLAHLPGTWTYAHTRENGMTVVHTLDAAGLSTQAASSLHDYCNRILRWFDA
jgi:hypothetical protein